MIGFQWLLLLLICCCICSQSIASLFSNYGVIRAPNVLHAHDSDLQRYCAILAATEPFKELCRKQIRANIQPLRYWSLRLLGKSDFQQAEALREHVPIINRVLERYESRVLEAVQCHGLSIDQFNTLSDRINQEKILKNRIALQAYFYKIAGDMTDNVKSHAPRLPAITKLDRSNASPAEIREIIDPYEDNKLSHYNHKVDEWYSETTPEKTRFAAALINIEYERLNMREKLKRDLHVNELPPKMADPEYLPSMITPIQRACREFPSLAARHIARCGLHIEEFNVLQQKVRSNPLYRFQVQCEIEKLQKIVANQSDPDN